MKIVMNDGTFHFTLITDYDEIWKIKINVKTRELQLNNLEHGNRCIYFNKRSPTQVVQKPAFGGMPILKLNPERAVEIPE